MKFWAGLLACFLLTAASVGQVGRASETPQRNKRQDTRKLMELVGTRQILSDMLAENIDDQIALLRRMRPDVPAPFWEEFAADFKKQADPQELMDVIVPIYDKHFTQTEIRKLIAFYQSPLGKKISTTLPEIQRESLDVGRSWGAQLGERVRKRAVQRLNEMGYGKKSESR